MWDDQKQQAFLDQVAVTVQAMTPAERRHYQGADNATLVTEVFPIVMAALQMTDEETDEIMRAASEVLGQDVSAIELQALRAQADATIIHMKDRRKKG